MRLACGCPQEACKTGGARPKRLGFTGSGVPRGARDRAQVVIPDGLGSDDATIERMLRDDPEALGLWTAATKGRQERHASR
jgi:hypothetical protein